MTTTTLNTKTFAQLFTATGGAGGTMFNASGNLVAQACPTFEADPNSGAPLGLRTRGWTSTNLVFPSAPVFVTDAYYTVTDATPLIVGQSALRFVSKGAGSPPVTKQAVAGDNNPLCCWAIIETDPGSVAGAVSILRLYKAAAPASSQAAVTFTHASGATVIEGTGATGGATKIKNVGPNGGAVWLVWVTAPIPTGTSVTQYAYPVGNGTVANQSSFIHHMQVERAARPSSAIITTTGAVTRPADTVTAANVSQQQWFNPAEFTLMVDFTLAAPPPSQGVGVVVFVSGGGTNRTGIYIGGGGAVAAYSVRNAAFELQVAGTTVIGINTPHRVVMSVKRDRMILTHNGALLGMDTSGEVADLTSGVSLAIGNLLGTATYTLDGWIRDVRYWPKAANATEILAMTPTTEVIAG